MFSDNKKLEVILRFFKKLIPRSVFSLFQPIYHRALALLGAVIYGFPARGLKIIGVTGTKGKSTVVYMISRALEAQGIGVAAIGSIEFKIKGKSWPNNLHMTMPGRMKLQRFLRRAKNAGAKYVVIEATSEGMKQGRLTAVPIDCAVFTNLHPEHIESHGGIENYIKAKQILFRKANNIHIINSEDKHKKSFDKFPARKKCFFGINSGDINQKDLKLKLKLKGDFNIKNALAALAVIRAYGFDIQKAKQAIENIEYVPGRMEYVRASKKQNFDFVVDYAHTPESLEAVYKELKDNRGKLICIFGSDGGGRDTWKRPVMGRIASQYCDEIILTSENPYDADPDDIADEIEQGIGKDKGAPAVKRIMNRAEAMRDAVRCAREGDTIVVTGKGTEDSIIVSGGRKIPWLDSAEAKEAILEIIGK